MKGFGGLLFILLYVVTCNSGDSLVAGGPGLALHLKRDGEHVLFNEFEFGVAGLSEITVEMWIQSKSGHTSFTPFSYSMKDNPLAYVVLLRHSQGQFCLVWNGRSLGVGQFPGSSWSSFEESCPNLRRGTNRYVND